jgi:hypothetical protein
LTKSEVKLEGFVTISLNNKYLPENVKLLPF